MQNAGVNRSCDDIRSVGVRAGVDDENVARKTKTGGVVDADTGQALASQRQQDIRFMAGDGWAVLATQDGIYHASTASDVVRS